MWLDLILDPFFKVERGYCICSIYVLTYFLHLNNYLVTFFHNTICRAQLFCPFLLSASEFLSNMLFNYHLLYFFTALSLIIMLSSHYHLHKSKTLIQLTQCPFTGTLLLFFKTMHKLLTYVHISSKPWATSGSAEQPLQALGDRARNQPKQHPSNRTV